MTTLWEIAETVRAEESAKGQQPGCMTPVLQPTAVCAAESAVRVGPARVVSAVRRPRARISPRILSPSSDSHTPGLP